MMKPDTKKYSIRVLQTIYCIVTDEQESHITNAAQLVDAYVKKIMRLHQGIDEKKAAILAGVQLASSLLHAQEELLLTSESAREITARIDQEIADLFI